MKVDPNFSHRREETNRTDNRREAVNSTERPRTITRFATHRVAIAIWSPILGVITRVLLERIIS